MAVYHDVASCYSTIRHHHHHHHHPGRGLRLVWQLTDATVTIQSYSIQRPTNGRPTNVYVELENCKRQLAKTAACPSRGPDESIPERSRSLVAELLIRCLCSDTESIFSRHARTHYRRLRQSPSVSHLSAITASLLILVQRY